jgi:hypothetical protein
MTSVSIFGTPCEPSIDALPIIMSIGLNGQPDRHVSLE